MKSFNLLEVLALSSFYSGNQEIEFKPEYRFHPDRKWRFDFACKRYKIAIEIEGGVFSKTGGRHNIGTGFVGDLEKYNEAQCLGWIVLRFTTSQVKNIKRCPEYVNMIRRAIKSQI